MDINTFTEKLRASPGTKRRYTIAVSQYLEWLDGHTPTRKNAQEFVDLRVEWGKANNTVATDANGIRAYFEMLEEPIKLKAPTLKIGDPKYRPMSEIFKLMDGARDPLLKTIITVQFDTGCRIAEILGLQVGDIDWEGGFVSVTGKGGHRADVNITDDGLDALRQWLKVRQGNHQRVFMDYDYNFVYPRLKKLAKRLGIEGFTSHQLRHSRAIQMRMEGAELHDVQQHLRHRSIATTANIYGRLRPADLKRRIPPWKRKSNGQEENSESQG